MQRHMLQHRFEESLSLCPRGVAQYAARHLDTITKILNHVLLVLFVLNVFLFFSCWGQSFRPDNTVPVLWMSFFLLLQNATVWAVLNNARAAPALSFLAPTDFVMGVALGVSVGAAALSFLLSHAFRYGLCAAATYGGGNRRTDDDRTAATGGGSSSNHRDSYSSDGRCHSSTGIWFWAGLVFWLNFCACLLLAVGRREFASGAHGAHYEPVGTGEPGGGAAATAAGSGYHRPGAAFAGDYATVPEVRPDEGMRDTSSHGSVSSRSESAKILSV